MPKQERMNNKTIVAKTDVIQQEDKNYAGFLNRKSLNSIV